MRKIFIFFICVFFSTQISIQSQESAESFYLGEAKEGEILTKEFVFSYSISSVLSFCDCLSLEVKEEGEKNILVVSFDTSGYKDKVCQEAILVDKDNNYHKVKFCVRIKD